MNLSTLSKDEKAAVLKTLMMIASADDNISYSEDMFLSMILLRMHEDQSFISYAHNLSIHQLTQSINQLSNSDKQELAYLWLKTASKSSGIFGMLCINDFPEEKEVIVKLAKACNVNIEDYLYNKVNVDSF